MQMTMGLMGPENQPRGGGHEVDKDPGFVPPFDGGLKGRKRVLLAVGIPTPTLETGFMTPPYPSTGGGT